MSGAPSGGAGGCAAVCLGAFTSIVLLVVCIAIGGTLSNHGGAVALSLFAVTSLGGGGLMARNAAGAGRGIGMGLMIGWAVLTIIAAYCIANPLYG